jgi:hypothetical protein
MIQPLRKSCKLFPTFPYMFLLLTHRVGAHRKVYINVRPVNEYI